MEKFMLLFQSPRPSLFSPEQIQENIGKWRTWIDKLRKEGRYVSGEPLLDGGKLVNGKNGNAVTDGPYTEGKEVVGGFFIIHAKDINEAAETAKEYPHLEQGGIVQVRQVMKMEM